MQQHHWGDVIAGAAIGWGASESTTVRYNNYAITAYPGFEGHPLGITLVARWQSGIITSKTSQGHPSMTWRVMGIAKLPGFLPTLSYQPTTLQNVLAAVATARAKREGIAVAARCLLLARPRQCLAQHWSAVQRIAALTRLDIDTLSDEFKVLSLNEPRNDVTLRFDAEPQLALSIRGNTEIADGLLCLRDVSRHSISTVPGTSHAASPISLPMGDSSS